MTKVIVIISGVESTIKMLKIRSRKHQKHAGTFSEFIADRIKTIYLDEARDSGDLANSVVFSALKENEKYVVSIGDSRTQRQADSYNEGINYAIPVEYGRFVRATGGRFARGKAFFYSENKSSKLQPDSWNVIKTKRGIHAIQRGINFGRKKAYRELNKKK